MVPLQPGLESVRPVQAELLHGGMCPWHKRMPSMSGFEMVQFHLQFHIGEWEKLCAYRADKPGTPLARAQPISQIGYDRMTHDVCARHWH